MDFRVTVGIGQDTVDPAVLDARAAALAKSVSGGSVLVDVVKAAVQVVLPVAGSDALGAIRQALDVVEQGVGAAGLDRPTSIAVIEAEAVTAAVAEADLRPHQPG